MTKHPSKTTETKTAKRAAAHAPIQAKLNISRPGDRYEVEADRAAAQMLQHIEGTSTQGVDTPANIAVSRLENNNDAQQRQCCGEEEEAQTKIQKQEEEEELIQPKVQRQAEEDEEEELLQPKVQRQVQEEEEEIQTKVQRKIGVEGRIAQRKDQGNGMDSSIRSQMESGFGTDFSQVRIHQDAEAAQLSSEINAQAFTTGNDIYFNNGKYKPGSSQGKSLLAHELTHVIQQNGHSQQVDRKASAGVTAGIAEVEKIPDVGKQVKILQAKHDTTIQRVGEETAPPETDTPATDPPAPTPTDEEQTPPPAPATPSLNLTPANTLLRGQTLKATIMFQPNAGESYRITAWDYETDDHGTINRPDSEATFQNNWEGVMATSGTLNVTYRITPAGGTEGAEETLSESITVNDRTGATWEATILQNSEGALSGKPSPPVVFSDLGLHEANVQMPSLTPSTISTGPNKQLRFIDSLTAGVYSSTPTIHPDLTNATSVFNTFHQHPGRLFLVIGTTKTLIPPTEYSNLTTDPTLSWDVPDWETFYKAHNFIEVTASANGNTFTLPHSAWALDANREDADVTITDDNAVRQGLNIGADETYVPAVSTSGSWSGHVMMQAAAILAGTQSHEYVHGTHSHRANFLKMMRALEPEKLIEKKVSSSTSTVNFNTLLSTWQTEILKPNHEIVDEQASATAEAFVEVTGQEMAGVNTDPNSGDFLGSIWNITSDSEMTN